MNGRYDELKVIPIGLQSVQISAYLPNPNERDYTRGYIDRFFIQKCNDVNSRIIEVSSDALFSLSNKSIYTIASLEWKISGNVDSVKSANLQSIRIASSIIPKLSLYLPNLVQFFGKG